MKSFLIKLFGLKAYPSNKPARWYNIYFEEYKEKGWAWRVMAINNEELCKSSQHFSTLQKCYENWFKMKTAQMYYHGLTASNWKTITKRFKFSPEWNKNILDKEIHY